MITKYIVLYYNINPSTKTVEFNLVATIYLVSSTKTDSSVLLISVFCCRTTRLSSGLKQRKWILLGGFVERWD